MPHAVVLDGTLVDSLLKITEEPQADAALVQVPLSCVLDLGLESEGDRSGGSRANKLSDIRGGLVGDGDSVADAPDLLAREAVGCGGEGGGGGEG